MIVFVCNNGEPDKNGVPCVNSKQCKKKGHVTTHLLDFHPKRWDRAMTHALTSIKPAMLCCDVKTRDVPMYTEVEEEVFNDGDIKC